MIETKPKREFKLTTHYKQCLGCGNITYKYIHTFVTPDGKDFIIKASPFCDDKCVEKYKELVREW